MAELPNLDFMRTVAVGLVFFGHLLLTIKIRGAGDVGHFGVLLFFVHTALVLMMSMERLGLSGPNLYAVFAVRRLFRVYPLNILSVIVAILFHIPSASWLGDYEWAGWQTLLSNIFLTQNITQSNSVNCVLWSLPFEIQMYAILPLLFAWTLRFPSLRGTYAVWSITFAISISEYVVRSGTCAVDFLLARYLPCFLAGVLAWRLMKIRIPFRSGLTWVLFLFTLILVYRLTDAVKVYGPGLFTTLHGALRNDHGVWWPAYFDLVNDWVFCAAVGLAIPLFREISIHCIKVTSKQVARYSYGIYVSHVPVLWLCFVKFRVGPALVGAVLAIFLTAVISVFAYHCLEHPAIQVGKRFAPRVLQRRVFA